MRWPMKGFIDSHAGPTPATLAVSKERKMIIRGREYVDMDEYLDEIQQYRLDTLKEGRAEKEEEESELEEQ